VKAKATAAVFLAALGTAAALAVGGVDAADPPTTSTLPPTVYVTTTTVSTVDRLYQGRGVRWWAARAIQARRDANARRDHVRRLQAANRARLAYGPSGLAQSFLCIHSYEGSWLDPGAPYYGGLQMDADFMATYGRPFYRALGPANNWPPFVQVAVSMAAYYSGRGFYPWPNTARACGLLP